MSLFGSLMPIGLIMCFCDVTGVMVCFYVLQQVNSWRQVQRSMGGTLLKIYMLFLWFMRYVIPHLNSSFDEGVCKF